MYAVVVVNIEAPLEGTFHYVVPRDMQAQVEIGHFVEIEFGRGLAQGIVAGFDDESPVEGTKPIIALIDGLPVVRQWQIDLAAWLSKRYMAPLNACMRLMLPPGLTRWAQSIWDVNPYWDGTGRLTEVQAALVQVLKDRGELKVSQLSRLVGKKSSWLPAARQLQRRKILRRTSILEAPRVRPKQVKTVEIAVGWPKVVEAAEQLGRSSLSARVLIHLLVSDDPLPEEGQVLAATGVSARVLADLAGQGLVSREPAIDLLVAAHSGRRLAPEFAEEWARLPAIAGNASPALRQMESLGLVNRVAQAATVSLGIGRREALEKAYDFRGAGRYYLALRRLLDEAQPIPVAELRSEAALSAAQLKRLSDLGLIRLSSKEVWRDPIADRDFVPTDAPRLTRDQEDVWKQVANEMGSRSPGEGGRGGRPLLLFGVTGSGKTEIYMAAIEETLRLGRQAIVLVPEIALTPQTVRRFSARFPGKVSLLHSGLSDGERYDTWRRARIDDFQIVVGPRSALFTPFRDPGVIIVDEEHDGSYKQTPPVPPPYYHAADAAVALSRLAGSTVILGSATPDVVSYHRARSGQFQLLELPKRVMGHRRRIMEQSERLDLRGRFGDLESVSDEAVEIPLPPIQIVDLRQELRAGNRTIFSRALQREMDSTLERGEQAILFLNRRGSATFINCRNCGLVLKCPRCDMPLIYHRSREQLVCHHCGRHEPPARQCPRCGSNHIRHFGLGTEELEDRVHRRWPEARLVRWDRDTTGGKDAHEQLLAGFINHDADILIGTQMIAKGLDLPFVTMVGVIAADIALGLPDFRSGERTFQLLAQVAGRAGRGLLDGRVIIQTYQPEHYAIQAAADHDYTRFYLDEMRFRTQFELPPYRRLARLVWVDPNNNRGRRLAEKLAKSLQIKIRELALVGTDILGPAPPYFNRIDGRYRWQIIIRAPEPARLIGEIDIPRGWIVDIDPVSTL